MVGLGGTAGAIGGMLGEAVLSVIGWATGWIISGAKPYPKRMGTHHPRCSKVPSGRGVRPSLPKAGNRKHGRPERHCRWQGACRFGVHDGEAVRLLASTFNVVRRAPNCIGAHLFHRRDYLLVNAALEYQQVFLRVRIQRLAFGRLEYPANAAFARSTT